MNLKKHKKAILQGVFLVIVFTLTIYGVFHGEDLGQLKDVILASNKLWLLGAVALVVAFIFGESLIIHYLMNSLKIRLGRRTCFLFSSVGFFFSCITPSASGGQPMQIYYMKKKGIPISVSTLVLMIVTIAYKMVLVLVGFGLWWFGSDFVHKYMGDYAFFFYLGIVLNTVLVIAMLVLVFSPSLAAYLASSFVKFLEKIHILKHKPNRLKKLEDSMKLYGEVSDYLKRNMKIIFNVLIITTIQRFALFATTYFVYRAVGLEGRSAIFITLLQAAISVSVDMLPLPGGMGISETLFGVMFLPIFGDKLLLSGLVLSRGISYYVQLLLSAAMTVVAQFTIGKHQKKLPDLKE